VEEAPSLVSFLPNKGEKRPRIYVDSREAATKNGKNIIEILSRRGSEVIIRKLNVGDFLLGNDVAVERKTIHDLAGTLTQRFLFDQLFRMKEAYPRSILLLEGHMGVLRKFRKITPEALHGALFALVQGNVPVVPTIDYKDTAIFLVTAAKQLLKEGQDNAVIRHRLKTKNLRARQLYAVTGLPHVGPALAERMLRKHGTVRKVFCASKEEFLQIDGVGSLITSRILEILDAPYEEYDQGKEGTLSTDE
jgi:ERCC4-type nuclease